MKLAYSFLFGLTYTVIYVFLALGLAGGGHGTFIFFAPLFTWILLFPAFFLLTRLRNGFINRVFFVVIMLIHYAHILIFLRPLFYLDFDPGTLKAWKFYPEGIIIATVWYLLGQLIMWLVFFANLRNQKTLE